MASIDNALTTLARAKSHLDITGSSKDIVLTLIILAASKYIENGYCRRKFKHQTFTQEVYDGRGSARLWLKNKPLVPGSSVVLQYRTSTQNEDSWTTIDASAYFINYAGGYLEFQRGYVDPNLGMTTKFFEGVQNYRVTYTSGYYLPSESQYQDGTDDDLDLPYELELVVLDIVSEMYADRQHSGVASEQVGDVKITYEQSASEAAEEPRNKNILDRYRILGYQ